MSHYSRTAEMNIGAGSASEDREFAQDSLLEFFGSDQKLMGSYLSGVVE